MRSAPPLPNDGDSGSDGEPNPDPKPEPPIGSTGLATGRAGCAARGAAGLGRAAGFGKVIAAAAGFRLAAFGRAARLGAAFFGAAFLAVLRLAVDFFAVLRFAEQVRGRCNSPRFRAGVLMRDGATVQPARLARGLRRVLLERGVQIFEQTPVLSLDERPVAARTPGATVRAGRAVVALNAWAGAFRPF